MPRVTPIATKEDFEEKVKKAEASKLVVVDFFATWCGPCKYISPKLEAMSDEFMDVLFFKVDVDEVADLAEDLMIQAMPTFQFWKSGEKKTEFSGANEENLRKFIEDNK